MSLSLSFVVLALCGWALWQLLSFVRIRIATRHLRRIPGPQSASFWTGNFKQFFARDGAAFQHHVARDYGPVTKLHGFFNAPILYISDPRALHTIIIKEENIFHEVPEFLALNRIMFGGQSLVATMGKCAEHARQRKLLNPFFSINHMRDMLPLFYSIVHKLRGAIATRIGEETRDIDVLGWMGRAALEMIGQGGLGYSLDPLVSDNVDEYGRALKSLSPALSAVRFYRRLLVMTQDTVPAWLRRAAVDLFPRGTGVHAVKEIIDTMDHNAHEIYNIKKAAFAKGDTEVVKQVSEGKDILSVLMRANAVADGADRLSDEEVVSQMSILIFAAMDTTSNALSRILHKLAENPDVQDKLRQELLEASAADGIPYDDLMRLPFLDSVCRETMRVYPPVSSLNRIATEDAVVPLTVPIYGTDGTRMDEIAIPKGTQVMVGMLGCNTSKALWGEDAYEWKPERWLKPLPAQLTAAHVPGVYSNLMSFMGGKRACIGFKFSELEMKVVLSVLLSNFTFELPDQPIVWNVSGVWYPSAEEERVKPQLPLKVGLYKQRHV
ncbi:hypothetical protein FOMPIDRAFT_1045154 [Fomitopsis schrenkii]|uniref:Cytochrome P450 n=1 Tax=Fomitopsis schrenkii TaxID=2126942 RepID=S8FVD0_FOMSC|nr:hypothetical protein FOMPIDRAFT_1045154 [Fomitopsis schrenkii]